RLARADPGDPGERLAPEPRRARRVRSARPGRPRGARRLLRTPARAASRGLDRRRLLRHRRAAHRPDLRDLPRLRAPGQEQRSELVVDCVADFSSWPEEETSCSASLTGVESLIPLTDDWKSFHALLSWSAVALAAAPRSFDTSLHAACTPAMSVWTSPTVAVD